MVTGRLSPRKPFEMPFGVTVGGQIGLLGNVRLYCAPNLVWVPNLRTLGQTNKMFAEFKRGFMTEINLVGQIDFGLTLNVKKGYDQFMPFQNNHYHD